MNVWGIMTSESITISGSVTVAEAVALLTAQRFNALVIKPRDRSHPWTLPKQMQIYEVMTKSCITVNLHLRIKSVARLFAQTHIHCALVFDNKWLGLISGSHVLRKSNFVKQPKQLFRADQIEAVRNDVRGVCCQMGAISQCAVA